MLDEYINTLFLSILQRGYSCSVIINAKHGIFKNTDIFFKLKYAINFTNINPSVSLLTFKAPVIINFKIINSVFI